MKKIVISFVLLTMLTVGHGIQAQSTLYKTYMGRVGVKATCIENYPIGGGMKVMVTMLEAQDSTAFRHLMSSLKSLPYSGEKRKSKRGMDAFVRSMDSLPPDTSQSNCMETMVRGILKNVKQIDMKMNTIEDANQEKKSKDMVLNLVCADPLPGDDGLYLIYNSNDMLTALVFHCPDDGSYAQAIVYVLKRTRTNTTLNVK